MIKDKIAPIIKNGPNGMYFCFFMRAHKIPPAHANTSAIPNPFVPSHNPPMPINLISPSPIGAMVSGFFLRICQSNTKPTNADIRYPNVAPMAASVKLIGQP